MPTFSYQQRRAQLETYFDRTAMEAWARLTSDAPVSRIRATVRAGRDEMRGTLLGWLPESLEGCRILDAGCGTGAFAIEAARRGAQVVAIDLAANLLDTARERLPHELAGKVEFIAGDMLDPALGQFDYAVAMDSLIHYKRNDVIDTLAALATRVDRSILFTFAPKTPLLAMMHAAGKCFPRGDRAPAIEPISPRALDRALSDAAALREWHPARTHRVTTGFYISQALQLVRSA